jgi:hypothetical protein
MAFYIAATILEMLLFPIEPLSRPEGRKRCRFKSPSIPQKLCDGHQLASRLVHLVRWKFLMLGVGFPGFVNWRHR